MDSASISDKPDASAPTDDIHRYHSQKSYPAKFAKVDKRALPWKRARLSGRRPSMYYVGWCHEYR